MAYLSADHHRRTAGCSRSQYIWVRAKHFASRKSAFRRKKAAFGGKDDICSRLPLPELFQTSKRKRTVACIMWFSGRFQGVIGQASIEQLVDRRNFFPPEREYMRIALVVTLAISSQALGFHEGGCAFRPVVHHPPFHGESEAFEIQRLAHGGQNLFQCGKAV